MGSSGNSEPISEVVFYSTHNMLNERSSPEEHVSVTIMDLGGKKNTTFTLHMFCDVEMLKRIVIKKLNLPPSINVSEIRIFHQGIELPNQRSLSPYVNEKGRIKFFWAFRERQVKIGIREKGLRTPPSLSEVINEIDFGFKRGITPKLSMDGTGGTYFLSDYKSEKLAIFKPRDEEAFAPNNPRGHVGNFGHKGFRSGVLAGEGFIREVAAFLLDAHYGGLAGVPETTLVEVCHPALFYRGSSNKLFWKEGSLQMYVNAQDTCGDYDPTVFSISDAHQIGILDLRAVNLDRNDGNILVLPVSDSLLSAHSSIKNNLRPDGKRSKLKLVPIDHGLILPDTIDLEEIDLVWFHWPQSKIPFSEEELSHILSLDADRDAVRLCRKLEIREECARTMRVSTRVLQLGAKLHLNLFQIAGLIVRQDNLGGCSVLEKAIETSLIQTHISLCSSSLTPMNRLQGNISQDLHSTQALGSQNIIKCSDVSESGETSSTSGFLSSGDTEKLKDQETPRNTVERKLCDRGVSLDNKHFDKENKWFNSKIQPGEREEQDISPTMDYDTRYASSPEKKEKSETRESSAKSNAGKYILKKSAINGSSDRLHKGQCRRKLRFERETKRRAVHLRSYSETWMLRDNYKKPIIFDWSDPLLDLTFFRYFELIMTYHIYEAHPNWQSYPFNGSNLVPKIENRISLKSGHHRKLDDK